MRKRLFLFLVVSAFALTFLAGSNPEGASGIGRIGLSDCMSASAPWINVDTSPDADSSVRNAGPMLRAVTLNIHSGMGSWKGLWSSRVSVQRRLNEMADAIAAVASSPVDVVALNEVDFSAPRSGNVDQALYLAGALEQRTGERYQVVPGQTQQKRFPGGNYGNAVLVRHAVSDSRACLFDDLRACGIADAPEGMPSLRATGVVPQVMREGRGLIKLTIDFHGRPIDVIVTHLEAVAMPEREAQAAHLLRRFVNPDSTTIVLGDVNAVPTAMTGARPFANADRTHDILTSGPLADARVLIDARQRRPDFQRTWATFPAEAPQWPLDAAFGSLDLFPHDVQVMDEIDTDHRGFYVAYRVLDNQTAIDAQRIRHDAIRGRQLAHILQCDISGPTQTAQLQWLRGGTLFATHSGTVRSLIPGAPTVR